MTVVTPLPRTSSVLTDASGRDRSLRVSWHDDENLFVVSTWRARVCVGTCRLTREDAATLIGQLADGLARPSDAWSAPTYDRFPSGWRARWQHVFGRRLAAS